MKLPYLSDRFLTSFKYSLRSLDTDFFLSHFCGKESTAFMELFNYTNYQDNILKKLCYFALGIGMYLYTEQLWQGEKISFTILRLQQQYSETTIYTHSSSESFQPSTADHINTQKNKYWPTTWGSYLLICSSLAKSLPVFRLPKLMGEVMQNKNYEAQGAERKGTSYSCPPGLQHRQKTTAKHRWPDTNSSELWSEQQGSKANTWDSSWMYFQFLKTAMAVQAFPDQQQSPEITDWICSGNRKDAANNLQCCSTQDTFSPDVQN